MLNQIKQTVMTAKEFFELNQGKYFMYNNEKVRVVGHDNSDIVVSFKHGDWVFKYITENHDVYVNMSLVESDECGLFVNIDDLDQIEQPELDLCKILEGCEGMVFYSTMVGYCRLIEITEYITIRYEDDDDCLVLESDGKYSIYGECTLFPSKENRDWSTFVNQNKIKEGTPVMTKWNSAAFWKLENYTKGNKSDFIVPVSEFDFTDFDSNKSKSIV